MSFIISDVTREPGGYCLSERVLRVVEPQSGQALASTQLKEGNENECYVKDGWANDVPSKHHMVAHEPDETTSLAPIPAIIPISGMAYRGFLCVFEPTWV